MGEAGHVQELQKKLIVSARWMRKNLQPQGEGTKNMVHQRRDQHFEADDILWEERLTRKEKAEISKAETLDLLKFGLMGRLRMSAQAGEVEAKLEDKLKPPGGPGVLGRPLFGERTDGL